MPLHTEIVYPVERLRAILADAGKANALSEDLGKDLAKHVFDVMPTFAATALTHGLSIATRNRRDFEPAGVDIIDPFAD